MIARSRLGLLAALAAAGCLPAGEPPQGQHLHKGRDSLYVRFQPAGAGEPARLVTLRDSTAPGSPFIMQSIALFELAPADPVTGQAQERLLLDNVLGAYDVCQGCGFPYDARGRLLLAQHDGAFTPSLSSSARLVRVDLKKDERTDLGAATRFSVSADRTLVLLITEETSATETTVLARVRDLDDRETPLQPAILAEMIGNDVYFVSKDQKLLRVRGTALEAAPELLAEDVGAFFVTPTARGPILVLARPTPKDGFVTTHSLFDPTTAQVFPVPGETEPAQFVQPWPSPDGRFLFFSLFAPSDRGSGFTISVLDRDTGASYVKPVEDGVSSHHWRPEHDEIWLQTTAGPIRWRNGGDFEPLPEGAIGDANVRPNLSIFTPDGRYVVSGGFGSPFGLRSADDPAGEPKAVGSKGTSVTSYWPLPDGRGIAEVYTTFQMHADLVLIDPGAGTSKTLGTGGWVIAVGAHHALAYLDWVKSTSSGTLALIDLDTGARKVLGENVYDVALETPATKVDRLPPGARVAFLMRHRIASPYDGVWMTTLP
jgi:hypothetical protein